MQLIQSAIKALHEVNGIGAFNLELYKMRCQLMTLCLLNGSVDEAFHQCGHVVSFLCVSLAHCPMHPLLGLQLFTLADLANQCDQQSYADSLYRWAREILVVTHGVDSSLYKQLADVE